MMIYTAGCESCARRDDPRSRSLGHWAYVPPLWPHSYAPSPSRTRPHGRSLRLSAAGSVQAGARATLAVDGHEDWPDATTRDGGPEGVACVVVARRHRPQRVSVCGYLVDVYCLGVKNALGPQLMNERDLPAFVHRFFNPFHQVRHH